MMRGWQLINDDGTMLRMKTAEARERVWEALDEMTPGVVFTSRDIWRNSWCPYGQAMIVLLKAQRLGYVHRVTRSTYVIPKSPEVKTSDHPI